VSTSLRVQTACLGQHSTLSPRLARLCQCGSAAGWAVMPPHGGLNSSIFGLFLGDEEACGLFCRAGLRAAHIYCHAGFYAALILCLYMLACCSTFILHCPFCLSFCECSRCARPVPCALLLRALYVPPFLRRLTRHNR